MRHRMSIQKRIKTVNKCRNKRIIPDLTPHIKNPLPEDLKEILLKKREKWIKKWTVRYSINLGNNYKLRRMEISVNMGSPKYFFKMIAAHQRMTEWMDEFLAYRRKNMKIMDIQKRMRIVNKTRKRVNKQKYSFLRKSTDTGLRMPKELKESILKMLGPRDVDVFKDYR